MKQIVYFIGVKHLFQPKLSLMVVVFGQFILYKNQTKTKISEENKVYLDIDINKLKSTFTKLKFICDQFLKTA